MSDTLVTSDLIKLYDSLFTDGGFTVLLGDDGSLTTATTGYAVADSRDLRTLPADTPFGVFAEAIERMYSTLTGANALGGWEHLGRLFIEPVEIYSDRAVAEQAGRLYGQIAIFDLDHSEEITL